MTATTITSQEFNRDTSKAKRAASRGPVFITNRDRKTHVLLSFEQYQKQVLGFAEQNRKIAASGESIVDMLAMPGAEGIDFEPPRMDDLHCKYKNMG